MQVGTYVCIDQVFSGEDSSRVQTAAEIEKILADMKLQPLKVLCSEAAGRIVVKDYKPGILHDKASLGVVAKQHDGELTVVSMYAEKTQSAIGRQDPKILLGETAAKTPVYVRVDYNHNDSDDCQNGIYIKVGNEEEYRVEVTVSDELKVLSHQIANRASSGRRLSIHRPPEAA